MMSEKGVSALVASVLLIAFTVSVAMIVMGWFSGFVRTTTENVSGVTQGAIGCSSGIIEIDHVYLNNATNDATMTVKNSGQIQLTVNGMIVNATGGTCTNADSLSLNPGSSGVLNFTNSDCYVANSSTFSSALITTSCAGITDSTTKLSDLTWV